MADIHESLDRFFDGELPQNEVEPFREHLATCDRCQRRMDELLQLDAIGNRHLQLKARQASEDKRVVTLAPIPIRRRWASRAAAAGGFGMVAAAAVALVVLNLTGVSDSVWQPGGPDHRWTEARSSYPRAAAYHPLDPGSFGPGDKHSSIPYDALGKLSGDHLGIASALLVRNDPDHVKEALEELQHLPEGTPDADAERSMAYLVRRDAERADLEAALRYASRALDKQPHHAPALWNKALALRELGLTMLAAKTFDEVAQLSEPGWALEARRHAEDLHAQADKLRREYDVVSEACDQAVKRGAPLPEAVLTAPVARRCFYDAVRTQTSADAVRAMMPLADKLDQLTGGGSLHAYIDWAAQRNFKVRARLAPVYGKIVYPPDVPDVGPLVRELVDSGEDDLVMGALIYSPAVKTLDEVARLAQLAKDHGDPWWEAQAEQQRAMMLAPTDLKAARQAAEHTIQIAEEAHLEYRAVYARLKLVNMLVRAYEYEAAREAAKKAWDGALRIRDWDLMLRLIEELGQMARSRNDGPVAVAYLGEAAEWVRGKDKYHERFLRQQLALLELNNLHVAEAREHLDAAIATGLPLNASGAFALAEVTRQKPSPLDRQAMDAVRATIPQMSATDQLLVKHSIGRWTIEFDPEQGRRLLQEAIAETERSPDLEGEGNKARVYSYTALIMTAAKQKDFAEVLRLFEKEAGAPFPATCAVALSVDSERGVAVVRGAGGAVKGTYDGTRKEIFPERLDGFVSPDLLKELDGCAEVKVLARAPLFGKVGALPNTVAWSYARPGHTPQSTPGEADGRLVVQRVALSEHAKRLELAAPEPWIRGPAPKGTTVLEGAAATPSHILEAMKSASDIDIVTHSLVNPVSDESYLVVAPEPTGDDALRATQISETPLPKHPIVTLSACHAAHTMHMSDQARSLPAAFLNAGARAVLAADVEVPQHGGPDFFEAVRTQIRKGISPAVALRDVRQRLRSEGQVMDWVESVLLFE